MTTTKSKRPLSITIICVLMALGAFAVVPIYFSQTVNAYGAWYPPYLVFSAIVGVISMIGLWTMKKWAVLLYAGMSLLAQGVLLLNGMWNIFSLILPGFIVWVLYSNYHKMK